MKTPNFFSMWQPGCVCYWSLLQITLLWPFYDLCDHHMTIVLPFSTRGPDCVTDPLLQIAKNLPFFDSSMTILSSMTSMTIIWPLYDHMTNGHWPSYDHHMTILNKRTWLCNWSPSPDCQESPIPSLFSFLYVSSPLCCWYCSPCKRTHV